MLDASWRDGWRRSSFVCMTRGRVTREGNWKNWQFVLLLPKDNICVQSNPAMRILMRSLQSSITEAKPTIQDLIA